MGQLFAVFSACRYCAWTYGQTSREALSRWEPRRCPSPNRCTGSTFLRFVSMVAVRHWPISAIGAPQPPTWRVGPALPCGILAKTHLATGKHDSWRRWCRFLAQVSGVFGAGVENGWEPAPLEGVGGRFAVQVPLPKTHLRQGSLGPAPRKPGTCVGVPGTGAQPQPEIRGACQCAPEAPVRPNSMLRQPKLSRGASRCATEGCATGVVMLCEFRVGEIRRTPRRTMEKPN